MMTLTGYSLAVWFCIGFFAGLGWAIANVLVSRLAARF